MSWEVNSLDFSSEFWLRVNLFASLQQLALVEELWEWQRVPRKSLSIRMLADLFSTTVGDEFSSLRIDEYQRGNTLNFELPRQFILKNDQMFVDKF